jgi:cytochrome c biogenesis protein CcmG, thiol:disulfide interchange protein DsbE
MFKRRHFLSFAGALAGAFTLALSTASAAYALEAGQAAPAFNLPGQDGKNVSLANFRGRYVYVDFWASWCGPCKQSFPWMNTLQSKLGPGGLQVLAINVDEKAADANHFLTAVPASFTVLFDAKGSAPAAYDVQGMPTSFLVGPDGKVLFVHKGFKDSDRAELEQKIGALIASKPAEVKP